jgi:serine/threonine protein kinase
LCPSNILIDQKTLKIKICDYGFTFLRKYCALLNGYKNKDVYSAPEILKQKGTVVAKHNESSDVYSFSMLAWFILEEETPFKNSSFSRVEKVVVEERSRPKLNPELNGKIVKMVRTCW